MPIHKRHLSVQAGVLALVKSATQHPYASLRDDDDVVGFKTAAALA